VQSCCEVERGHLELQEIVERKEILETKVYLDLMD